MKARFFELAERLGCVLQAGEMLLCEFSGERSDFVRFNRGKVRQAGSVEQGYVSLRLIRERRQASASLALGSEDFDASRAALDELRGVLDDVPEDPWLLFNETPHSASSERRGRLVSADAATEEIIAAAQGQDLVGIYAGGTICRGFANSLGQRNWHEVDSFNFDWSLCLEVDKAVNPAGIKGLGELGNVGTNAAVANAVFHATGVRVRTLPIRLEKLLEEP